MTFFYLLLIVHILFGLFCAALVKSTRFKAEVWFVAGTVFGGLGFLLCWLCVMDSKRALRPPRIVGLS